MTYASRAAAQDYGAATRTPPALTGRRLKAAVPLALEDAPDPSRTGRRVVEPPVDAPDPSRTGRRVVEPPVARAANDGVDLSGAKRSQLADLALELRRAVSRRDEEERLAAIDRVAEELFKLSGDAVVSGGREAWIKVIQQRLKLRHRRGAALLAHLLDHPNEPQTHAAIARALGTKSTTFAVQKVYVHWLRVSLRERGLGNCIETLHREGYYLPARAVPAILALLV